MSKTNGTAKAVETPVQKAQREMQKEAERRCKLATDIIQDALKKYNCGLVSEPIFKRMPGNTYAISGQCRVVPL